MAITKIHAIRSTIQKSVDYICNPHKTDNRILIDNYGCGLESAGLNFLEDNLKAIKIDNAKPAFHLIQSFAPGEVTFEEAHKIGGELAQEILGETRAYVLATHIDREHVHNHIIFCSADFETGKRYYDNKESYRKIRNVSDRLCKEYGLSVIEPGDIKGMKYNEWQADKKNNSHKFILKKDIFECIRNAKDYEDFLRKMMEKGYLIKGYELGENAPKYISFKPPGYGNFIRGCAKNLGKGHTKEEIIERIEKQIISREAWKEKQKSLSMYEHKLIDTSKEKYVENPQLRDWADLTNLKIAASTYAHIDSITELYAAIDLMKKEIKQNRSEITSIDKELRLLQEQLRYLKIYNDNEAYNEAYKKSKSPDEYFMEHESHLLLFDGAAEYLSSHGINPLDVSERDLENQIRLLEHNRTNLQEENNSQKLKLDDMIKKQKTLDEYLHKEKKQEQEASSEKERENKKRRDI